MKRQLAFIGAVIVTISFSGCGVKSPKGFYRSGDDILEFRSKGMVIMRDLGAEIPTATESTFAVEKDVVRIHHFTLLGITNLAEFSMIGDTLVDAKGLTFTKDTSGRTYSPAEILAEARARKTEAERLRLQRQEVEEREQKRIMEQVNAETKRKEEDTRKQQEATALASALERQAKAEKARANDKAKKDLENAKRYAAEHLPTFTNKVATIQCNDGTVYTNILLKRCGLDGIVYGFTDTAGGGIIPYTKLDVNTLESLNIDTNIVAVAKEREAIKAELDRQHDQVLVQDGAAKANDSIRSPNNARKQAFDSRYGRKR